MLHMVQLQSSLETVLYSTAQRHCEPVGHRVKFYSTVHRQYILGIYSTVLQHSSETVRFMLHTVQSTVFSFKFYHHYNRKTPLKQLVYFVIYSLRIREHFQNVL